LKEEDVFPYYGFLDDSIEIKSLFPQASKKSKFITNLFLGIYFVFAENNFNSSLF
jgi:hypothetical protein